MSRDRRKLYVYFIAPQRVDFVALVKDLFKVYKTRIWMHNSSASHLEGLYAPMSSFLQSPQAGTSPTEHNNGYNQLSQPPYDYYRNQRNSPGQQQYFPPMHHQPVFNPMGGFYSPQQQYYAPASRGYPPMPPVAHPPPPMQYQPAGQPGPSSQAPHGQW
jgi:PSP1 C-terminal conserved region